MIPYEPRADGSRILLITSARRKKWIIPKGVIEPGYGAEDSAAKEAVEEAGVLGLIRTPALGSYEQSKWGGICHIEVFLLEISEVLTKWPEKGLRRRKWFTRAEAISCVEPSGLKRLLALVP